MTSLLRSRNSRHSLTATPHLTHYTEYTYSASVCLLMCVCVYPVYSFIHPSVNLLISLSWRWEVSSSDMTLTCRHLLAALEEIISIVRQITLQAKNNRHCASSQAWQQGQSPQHRNWEQSTKITQILHYSLHVIADMNITYFKLGSTDRFQSPNE